MAVDSTRCPPNINSRHNALNSYHHSGHPSFPRSKSLNLSQHRSNQQPVPRLVYPQVRPEQSSTRSLSLSLSLSLSPPFSFSVMFGPDTVNFVSTNHRKKRHLRILGVSSSCGSNSAHTFEKLQYTKYCTLCFLVKKKKKKMCRNKR